ncbi:hypothetical protein Pfo_017406 [Paulownia fortunei]|nr:hypothetical protein Pfo_017406 [Paulownia fortunei]
MGSGNSQQPPLLSSLESHSKEKCGFSNPLWRKPGLEFQSRRKCFSQQMNNRRIFMKRRARFDRSIRPRNPIERKVRILKKLIPNCTHQSMGVERLFGETADYIVALQMRVKVMQIMVDALSSGSDDE